MITKNFLRQITYKEWGEIVLNLENDIKAYVNANNVKFDLVVPILRSGGFAGLHIASKLKITHILPAQYKYEFTPKETIVKRFEFPLLLYELPEKLNILVTDSNTVFGGIASKVISDIKALYPDSIIYFASANLDYSAKEMKNVEKVFYGVLSNEKRELSLEEAEQKGITNDVIIFPWEDLEEQWEEINASQSQ